MLASGLDLSIDLAAEDRLVDLLRQIPRELGRYILNQLLLAGEPLVSRFQLLCTLLYSGLQVAVYA